MPCYDLRCTHCDNFIEDIILSYEDMKAYRCPTCSHSMESVPGQIAVNTSESRSFIRVPPERKAEFNQLKERSAKLKEETKERSAERAKHRSSRRGG